MLRLALLLLLIPVLLFAQPDTLWTRTFDGPGYALHSVCVTADDHYVAVGEGHSTSTFGYDVRSVRFDAGGTVQWDRVADTGQHEYGRVVLATRDGGYIAAGCAHAYVDDWPYELILARMNAQGDTQWCRIFGGMDMWETYVMGMDTVPGGGYVLMSTADVDTSFAPLLLRVSETGDSLWSRTYRRNAWDNGVSVVSLNDGFAILGTCAGSWAGSAAYHLIRTNTVGDTLWTRAYFIPPIGNSQAPVCICRAPDGGFMLGGNVYLADRNMIWLVRTDSHGDTLWTKLISPTGAGGCEVGDVEVTSDGGFVVAGSDGQSWMLAKLDREGNTVWTKSVDMGAAGGVALESVQETSDGGYVAAGGCNGHPFALKTTPDFSDVAGEPPRIVPRGYSLQECSPNPFNATTRIGFDLPVTGYVTLDVFDVTGRKVTTLLDGNSPAGPHSVLFDGGRFASGVYFLQLTAGDFRGTRKMVLLK